MRNLERFVGMRSNIFVNRTLQRMEKSCLKEIRECKIRIRSLVILPRLMNFIIVSNEFSSFHSVLSTHQFSLQMSTIWIWWQKLFFLIFWFRFDRISLNKNNGRMTTMMAYLNENFVCSIIEIIKTADDI